MFLNVQTNAIEDLLRQGFGLTRMAARLVAWRWSWALAPGNMDIRPWSWYIRRGELAVWACTLTQFEIIFPRVCP